MNCIKRDLVITQVSDITIDCNSSIVFFPLTILNNNQNCDKIFVGVIFDNRTTRFESISGETKTLYLNITPNNYFENETRQTTETITVVNFQNNKKTFVDLNVYNICNMTEDYIFTSSLTTSSTMSETISRTVSKTKTISRTVSKTNTISRTLSKTLPSKSRTVTPSISRIKTRVSMSKTPTKTPSISRTKTRMSMSKTLTKTPSISRTKTRVSMSKTLTKTLTKTSSVSKTKSATKSFHNNLRFV